MALFTGKGDGGTSKTLRSGKGERSSKADPIFEALGSVDEVNSYLGLVKVVSAEEGHRVGEDGPLVADIVHGLQMDLFIVQAELAGVDMRIDEEKVHKLTDLTNELESHMPPIHSFFVSGGTRLAAMMDIARTLARRAERRVITATEDDSGVEISEHTKAFVNRLSSVLYALARYANHKAGVCEVPPTYE